MGATKAVQIRELCAWAFGDSHDIALASMVVKVDKRGVPDWLTEELNRWRVQASIPDIGLCIQAEWDESRWRFVQDVIRGAMGAVRIHGAYEERDVENWSILEGSFVSGGEFRVDLIESDQVIDVLLGFSQMVDGTLPPLANKESWFFGATGGRRII